MGKPFGASSRNAARSCSLNPVLQMHCSNSGAQDAVRGTSIPEECNPVQSSASQYVFITLMMSPQYAPLRLPRLRLPPGSLHIKSKHFFSPSSKYNRTATLSCEYKPDREAPPRLGRNSSPDLPPKALRLSFLVLVRASSQSEREKGG